VGQATPTWQAVLAELGATLAAVLAAVVGAVVAAVLGAVDAPLLLQAANAMATIARIAAVFRMDTAGLLLIRFPTEVDRRRHLSRREAQTSPTSFGWDCRKPGRRGFGLTG